MKYESTLFLLCFFWRVEGATLVEKYTYIVAIDDNDTHNEKRGDAKAPWSSPTTSSKRASSQEKFWK